MAAGRERGSSIDSYAVRRERVLARFHRGAVVVAEQVEEPWTSGQRHSAPTTCGQRTTSPSARGTPVRQLVAAVDREREHVGRLVDAEVLAP